MSTTLTIPYKPRPYQLDIHNDSHRFKIAVFHRQAGKTTFALNELIKKMVIDPGVYLYVAPEKSQAKNIIWKDPQGLFKYLPRELIAVNRAGAPKINEVELSVTLKPTLPKTPGSIFYIEGTDNIDRMRGIKPKGVILDEYAQMKSSIWTEILFPAINQSNGWVIFIGTFKGKNHFYDLFSKYWDWSKGESISNQDYKAFYLPYNQNPYFTPDQLRAARETMPDLQFKQEYGCEPMSGTSSVFPSITPLLTGSLKDRNPNHFYSMGVDLAKSVDYTSVSIIDRNTFELVYQERWQGEWSRTIETIVDLYKSWNRPTLTIDSTGVGDPVSELLKRRGVRCEDFKFSNKSKDQLVKKMCLYFDEKKIKLPPIDQATNLITELEQFSYEILESGRIKYSAPTGKHDDEVMSLGLAIWSLKDSPESELFTTSVPRQTVPELDPFN